MTSSDPERTVILARRQRLILAALGSVSSLAGCASGSTSSTHAPATDSHECEPSSPSTKSVATPTLSAQESLVAQRTPELSCAELMSKPNELRTSDPMLACAEVEEPELPRIQELDARPCLLVAPERGGIPNPARPEQAERSGAKSRSQKKCLRPKRFW
jgi:hypothetical protein